MVTSARRLSDFEQRARFSPEGVVRHSERGWPYIPVHPFADDHTLLARIQWPSERCLKVDAYWEIDGEVYLLEVHADGDLPLARGIYYRWDGGVGYLASLFAVLEPAPVIRSAFEATMVRFAAHLPLRGKRRELTPLPDP
jgi:hypothetical protein